MEVNQRVRKNKNKNNFILHRSFVITNTSCQICFDENIMSNTMDKQPQLLYIFLDSSTILMGIYQMSLLQHYFDIYSALNE